MALGMDSNIPDVKLDVTLFCWRVAVSIDLYMRWYGSCADQVAVAWILRASNTAYALPLCFGRFCFRSPHANGRRSLNVLSQVREIVHV
jgi:hypothetical protein